MDVRPGRFAVFAAALAYVLFFYHASAVGLLGPDEPRYAQVAREMLRTGDYVTPRLLGQPWFEKPPLYYWMAAASFRFFGVNEAAARLPSAVAAAAFLILFAWTTQRLLPGETWRYAVLILLSSLGWIGFARAATMDMLFAGALSGALGFLALWVWQGRRRWLFAFHGLLALSVLAKGLGGIVLAGLILLVYCAVVGEYAWLWRVLNPLPLTLFAVIALPWYGIMYFKHGNLFIHEFIIKQHFARYVSDELAHPGAWWYYAPVLLAGIFPWSAHLASLRGTGLDRDHRRMFLLVWIAVVLVFFSASRGKLPGYILPALPALAMWMGEEWKRSSTAKLRVIGAAQAVLLLLLGIASWIFVLPALVVLWFAWRGRRFGAVVLAAAIAAGAMLWMIPNLAPRVNQNGSARSIAPSVCGKRFVVGAAPRQILYGLEFYCDRDLTMVTKPEYALSTTQPKNAIAVEKFPEGELTLWKLRLGP